MAVRYAFAFSLSVRPQGAGVLPSCVRFCFDVVFMPYAVQEPCQTRRTPKNRRISAGNAARALPRRAFPDTRLRNF